MPRRPDTICAGRCGRVLWAHSKTSLPAGQRTCHPCRRAGYGPRNAQTSRGQRWGTDLVCPMCQKPFRSTGGKTCSVACGIAARRLRCGKACCDCGNLTEGLNLRCGPCRQAARLATSQRKNLRRRTVGSLVMSIAELGARDRWRCHLCRRPVASALSYPDPMSASRDHLLPVAAGGTNDPANLALAHWICNVKRGVRGTIQLRLVG